MSHLIGLDIGSTLIKAARFDAKGRVLTSAAVAVKVRRPFEGWVERDLDEAWKGAASVLKKVSRLSPDKIIALGVTGCGNGAVFLDQHGRSLRPGILSSDTRAVADLPRGPRGSGPQAYPGQLPRLLRWFRKHEPGRARRLSVAFFWKDYVRAKLTGRIATDFTDAGAAGLLKFPLRQLRVSDPAVPPLQESLSRAGSIIRNASGVTGLPEGLAVYTGCIDCEAAAIGSGVGAAGEVSMVAGTWSINQAFVRIRPGPTSHHFLINPSVDPNRWLVLEGSPSSAGNFEWAARLFEKGGNVTRAERIAARAKRTALLFFPNVPSGRGALIGLSANHDRGAIYRAVMEGVVFAHRIHLDKLKATTGRTRLIRLSGGATQSKFWCQLFADGLGCTVAVPSGTQLGAMGAAICAGVGHGLWPSLDAAQSAMTRTSRLFHPRSAMHRELSRDFKRYRRLLPLLPP